MVIVLFDNKKDFLETIAQKFNEFDKDEITNLLRSFSMSSMLIRVVWGIIFWRQVECGWVHFCVKEDDRLIESGESSLDFGSIKQEKK